MPLSIQQRSADEQRGIFRKSTSLLCLRRSFYFSTSKIPYGWQRKVYFLDFANTSRYIFASVGFRISFSRNKWLSFSVRWSTHGTQLSVVFLFLHSWNNCRELQAVLNALCNSQDILLCFLLSTPLPFGQWFVVRLQSCLWFPFLLIAPLVFLNCYSPCPTFLFADVCPVWWGIVNWKMREMLLNC